MCQLQFTIQTSDVDGDSIKAVRMRYRIFQSSNTWTIEEYPSINNITNETILQTPNLTGIETYEFEVQVQDVRDNWSEWFSDPNNPIFNIGRCVNKPPTAKAGVDQTITLPTDSVMLTGTGSSDSDGSIASYLWTKETSLASTITNANTAEATVTGMEAGIHVFKLTVTDDGDVNGENNLTGTDTVQITVEPAVEPSKPYYIGLGDCETAPRDWIQVWTPKGNVDTIPYYIPDVGDVFYTDSSLETLYKPASTSHIVGFSEPPNTLQEDKSYTIDSNGAVISIVNCDTPIEGSNDATIVTPAQDSDCESCMSVRVDVPEGETREVSITKSGLAGYSGISPCSSGTVITRDTNETISETKTYSFGLDAASGNQESQSNITLSVTGSNSVTLSRLHGSSVEIC